jgi:hypothetical protein
MQRGAIAICTGQVESQAVKLQIEWNQSQMHRCPPTSQSELQWNPIKELDARGRYTHLFKGLTYKVDSRFI